MAPKTGAKQNFYNQAKNDPEMLAKRAARQAKLDAKVEHMMKTMPGRVPNWHPNRLMQLDRFCLEAGKRCIMWDDEGAGFYLMMNWDWLRNQPSEPASFEERWKSQGWWLNVKEMMRPPLMDNTCPADKLAEWIDKHTMRVHGFLDKLGKLRRDPETQKLVMEDPYWDQLQQLPAWDWRADPKAFPERSTQQSYDYDYEEDE